MNRDRKALIRQLIPKSYHFDGYNLINCQNSRDRPFFTNGTVTIENYTLTCNFVDKDKLSLNYESVCPIGKILFEPYILSIDEFIEKLHEASKRSSDFISFPIRIKTVNDNSNCKNCIYKNSDCINIQNNISQNTVLAAVSFNYKEIKEALAYYFEISSQNSMNKGGLIMKKNKFFGINFEFGLSKDPNIVSTLMGVAIRNPKNDNYVIYDKNKNKLTDIANMKMGDLPILLLPTKELKVGTLTKHDSKYYFVKSVNGDGTIVALEPATGEIKTIMLKESLVPGLTFYTQVIAMNPASLTDLSSNENVGTNVLAAICMMNWSKGDMGNEFSLDSVTNDSFNGLGQYLPLLMMNLNGNNSSLNNWSTLMLLSGADGDDAMQMLMLSQLLDGKSPFDGMLPETTTTQTSTTDGVTCTNCNKTYSADTKFCPICGKKTEEIKNNAEVTCPNCNKQYSSDVKFCPKCGTKTIPIANTCKSCGAKLSEGALFCHNCGKKIIPNTCPNCGSEVESDQKFCSNCGKDLKEKPSTTTKNTEKSSNPTSEPEVTKEE